MIRGVRRSARLWLIVGGFLNLLSAVLIAGLIAGAPGLAGAPTGGESTAIEISTQHVAYHYDAPGAPTTHRANSRLDAGRTDDSSGGNSRASTSLIAASVATKAGAEIKPGSAGGSFGG